MSRVQLHHMVKKPTSHNVSPTCLQQKETPNVRCSHRGGDEAQKIKRDILRDAEVTGSHECKEVFSFMVTRNVNFVWLDVLDEDWKDFPSSLFSFACDFLDGGVSSDCCSIDSLTGLPCRRSPRLLTNGYYLWTEDSFLCDKDGNVTLSPPQTSVTYKENLVR